MTINEATTLLASQLSRELDMPFKLMLAERIKVWRARLLRNTLDKDAGERKFFRQTVYIPMVTGPDVPCPGVPSNCRISVSKFPVPAPLRANNILFDYVGAINGMNPFQEANIGMVQVMEQGKYSKGIVRYTWISPYITLYRPDVPMIRIVGIFDDPLAAAQLNCDCGMSENCDIWNQEYPISNDLMQLVIQSIITIDFQRGVVPATREIEVNEQDDPVLPRSSRPQAPQQT